MIIEYRIAVLKNYGSIRYHPKRDLDHAEKGVEDSYRDFRRNGGHIIGTEAWIETRTVTEWEKTT